MKFAYGIAIIVGSLAVWVIASSDRGHSEECANFQEETLIVKDVQLSVAVARTRQEQVRGLGGCTSMPEGSGMYFPYEEERETAFWMKDMHIPIDIIWIRDGEIVGIEHEVQPERVPDEDLTRYYSPGHITAVLEVNAGKSNEWGIEAGDTVEKEKGDET